MRPMRVHSLSPCILVGLWKGFVRVHGKENALSFYALGTVSGGRQKRGVAEMKNNEVSAEKR